MGVGVLERQQSRSLQNLPSEGGWSWVEQAGMSPGFRGATECGCMCVGGRCFGVSVDLEVPSLTPGLRLREIKEVGGEGLGSGFPNCF